jgi:hypothetical protein
MSFLKNIFKQKEEPVRSYADFWNWFQKNERTFYKVIKEKGDIEKDFFDKLSPKLGELKDGFFFLAGMLDTETAELVLTADGNLKNIVFVEELVAAAPKIGGWKFTASKPAMDIKNVVINMAGYEFKGENMSFYANDDPDFPDQIDVTIVHNDLDEKNKKTITNGTYIFLDNFLGELNFVTTIDEIDVVGKKDVQRELVPIEKLKDFLIWREKEFVEKYEGLRHDTESDNYSMLEAHLESGNALIAVINTDLLNWDSKASHPWILTVEITYNGEGNNGMPDDETFKLLGEIEDEILAELKDADGYLNIGRQTAESVREIYFACKDFRKPAKVLYAMTQKYAGAIAMDYDIYKDKYWLSFDRFVS